MKKQAKRPAQSVKKLSLSKNYASAPISGKIGMGVLSWKSGEKMRDETQSLWT